MHIAYIIIFILKACAFLKNQKFEAKKIMNRNIPILSQVFCESYTLENGILNIIAVTRGLLLLGTATHISVRNSLYD